jgi:general stress protein 26
MTMATMTFEDLASKIRKIDFCMLSTTDGMRSISSRPMSNNGDVEYNGDSWFFSYEHTRKIGDIEGVDDVLLTFTEPPGLLERPGIFIAIQGKASIVRDNATFKEHWVSGLERWFPEGAETPDLVLIKVSALSVYYWDGEDNGEVAVPKR